MLLALYILFSCLILAFTMISSRLTQRGNLYLTALLIDEGEETFVGEIFLGDFLYLLRGDFVYLLVEMLDVLEPAIM